MLLIYKELCLLSLAPQLLHPQQFVICRLTARRLIMRFLRMAQRRLSTVGELFWFFATGKRWWMLPIMAVLFVSGALLILAQSSAIAPFIYTLF